MVRKIKTSEVNIENVSYDAVLETVTKIDEATNEEPVKQEMPPGNVAEQIKQETTQNVLERQKQEMPLDNEHPAEQLEKKPKKETEKGTCPNCGKTMTLKNLKYSHSKKCNVNTDTELKEEIMEIPKPILVRTDSTLPPEEIEKPETVKKPEAIKKPKSAAKLKTVVEVISDEPVEVVEVPTVQKKPRTTRPKKVPESVAVLPSEPVVMKKSRAVLKAEKYESLFQNAI